MSGLNDRGCADADPIVVPQDAIDHGRITRAPQNFLVWVALTFDDGRSARPEGGFARAWTDRHVLVQVLWQASYSRAAREFWVEAGQVTRRVIAPSGSGQHRLTRLSAAAVPFKENVSSIYRR